jgi:hypothetical protein
MIKFEVADDPAVSHVVGTSLKGTIKTSYGEIEDKFGEPTIGPNDRTGDKTTCEWHIEFHVPIEDDGMGDTDPNDYDIVVATIYDWKNHETPMERTIWHVGGKSHEAEWLVSDVLEGK